MACIMKSVVAEDMGEDVFGEDERAKWCSSSLRDASISRSLGMFMNYDMNTLIRSVLSFTMGGSGYRTAQNHPSSHSFLH